MSYTRIQAFNLQLIPYLKVIATIKTHSRAKIFAKHEIAKWSFSELVRKMVSFLFLTF